MSFEKNGSKLSAREKQEARFQRWLNPENPPFASPQIKTEYQYRINLIKDAVQMEKVPDSVPFLPNYGLLPATMYGLSAAEALADVEKACQYWERFYQEYDMTLIWTPAAVYSSPPLDALDFKFYNWPGHNAPDNSSVQYVEAEYMKVTEYSEAMLNPSHYWMTKILPRIAGNLDGLKYLNPASSVYELMDIYGYLYPFGMPEVQEAFESLIEAGRRAKFWLDSIGNFTVRMQSQYGLPAIFGNASKAPFDILADTMRGIQNFMMDLIKRPDELTEVLEKITQLAIDGVLTRAAHSPAISPLVFFPLHMGADGFIGKKHWEKLYWPYLKRVLMALIDEGYVPYCFAEGGYNSRLEYLTELPKGSSLWSFDRTDMAQAKKILGGHLCFAGNVGPEELYQGDAANMRNYCEQLIKTCAPGGGFMLSTGVVLDDCRPEILRAMIDALRDFGKY